ncbi:DMT family transporter [Epilithonimonas sp.]|uniref:DMT family transporter n=1 Tax=Epilithonimonas sp. TaxID=2894511 RepID=UPI0028A18884|nr:DMT family transporter [Epilithonimonas sp.]
MIPEYRNGLLILILAIFCWASGTIYTKKLHVQNNNLFLNLFYQFAWAGIVQLIFAFTFSDKIDISAWSVKSISAIIYLAIFGSVLTFFAYNYLLKTLLPTQVSMLSYVNTIISIFLSWLILGEVISEKFIIATALIISGVFIINYKPGMFKQQKINHS